MCSRNLAFCSSNIDYVTEHLLHFMPYPTVHNHYFEGYETSSGWDEPKINSQSYELLGPCPGTSPPRMKQYSTIIPRVQNEQQSSPQPPIRRTPVGWPRGVQEVKAPRFLDTRHMKLVRSSPLSTGRLYPQEYPGTHFLRLRHMYLSDVSEKIPSDTSGDRSRDLPTSSATALPQALMLSSYSS